MTSQSALCHNHNLFATLKKKIQTFNTWMPLHFYLITHIYRLIGATQEQRIFGKY